MSLTLAYYYALLILATLATATAVPQYTFYEDHNDFRVSYNLPTDVRDKYNILRDNSSLNYSMIGNYGVATYVNLVNMLPKSIEPMKIGETMNYHIRNNISDVSSVIAALGLDCVVLDDKLNEFFNSTPIRKSYDDSYISKRNEQCSDGWWFNHYDSLIKMYERRGNLKAWLREHFWINTTSFIKLGRNMATVCNYIAGALKRGSTKTSCNGFSYWLNLDALGEDRLTYMVGIAPFTSGKNCDTQVSIDSIKALISNWLIDTADHNMAPYCTRFHDAGSWWADVRLIVWDETANVEARLFGLVLAKAIS
ncbi:uncharacterized protein KLLA0_D00660g [Kluyveromyces lactis]|uniref:KLLA0D00660p n=1 Tax=Kluyveromyces lactis (strain ATCC 8585 / CBS 2359 / DSM 70799 / NBRC 1267 / NRRL Y-1140 / WM37) TaxID=284590 RepID=Q6CSI8_KLULA|nr:uncharacterized protein KLLA0_D00660g [Kluyveromyces lactis]CAH00197.1 KLLA0D00660p [Kluyveromyces lactis]|eukprot:XP_453101.1 uncharacterized protein KLLA0_D00660g [Kluyveromyces lactis]